MTELKLPGGGVAAGVFDIEGADPALKFKRLEVVMLEELCRTRDGGGPLEAEEAMIDEVEKVLVRLSPLFLLPYFLSVALSVFPCADAMRSRLLDVVEPEGLFRFFRDNGGKREEFQGDVFWSR